MAKSTKRLISDALKIFEENSKKNGITGVPSGFKELDRLTYGWQPGDLIIIGGRPGMGKTAFALSMINNMAIGYKHPVAFFSLETTSHNLITRMISGETGIPTGKLKTGKLEPQEWEMLNVKLTNLYNAPIYFDDTPALSISDLTIQASRLVIKKNVKVVVVDYLQLLTLNKLYVLSRKEEIDAITKSLKNLAKELNIAIIALSQISRSVEFRGGSRRPILSDLRESGAIEQNADIVSFIYRPEYYGILEWDDEDRTPCEGEAELIVAKNRNGGIDNIRLKFVGHLAKFLDLDYEPF